MLPSLLRRSCGVGREWVVGLTEGQKRGTTLSVADRVTLRPRRRDTRQHTAAGRQ